MTYVAINVVGLLRANYIYINKDESTKKSITFEREDFSAACIYLDLTTVPDAID